jgi:hypothetical protein
MPSLLQRFALDRWLRSRIERILDQLSPLNLARVVGQADVELSRSIALARVAVVKAQQAWACYQSSKESHLSIIVRSIHGILYVLHARPSDSIGLLKHKIWCKSRRRLEGMMLVFAGVFLNPDASTLLDHGMVDQSVIHVLWDASPYLHLFILSYVDGGFYGLLMHPEDTVRDVKERIQTQEGILTTLQQLSLSGQILDDDHQLIRYSTLMIGCPLVLQLRVRVCTVLHSGTASCSFDVCD